VDGNVNLCQMLTFFLEAKLRKSFLDRNIEIGAGLGIFAGKAVRVGIMGSVNANVETVQSFLKVLDEVLPQSHK
jgi:aspartate aminotransferase-like enzyme